MSLTSAPTVPFRWSNRTMQSQNPTENLHSHHRRQTAHCCRTENRFLIQTQSIHAAADYSISDGRRSRFASDQQRCRARHRHSCHRRKRHCHWVSQCESHRETTPVFVGEQYRNTARSIIVNRMMKCAVMSQYHIDPRSHRSCQPTQNRAACQGSRIAVRFCQTCHYHCPLADRQTHAHGFRG